VLVFCIFIPDTRIKLKVKTQMCSLQVLNQKHFSEIRVNNFFTYLVVQRGHMVHTVSLNIHNICFLLERHCMPTKSNWQNYFCLLYHASHHFGNRHNDQFELDNSKHFQR
jgi:predicted LPLAT superfamily acyltransferase